jgi:hypothetical protein
LYFVPGIMERWNDGKMGVKEEDAIIILIIRPIPLDPLFHYSSIPTFQL